MGAIEIPNAINAAAVVVPVPVAPFADALVQSRGVQSFVRLSAGQYVFTLETPQAFSQAVPRVSFAANTRLLGGAQVLDDGTVHVSVFNADSGLPEDPDAFYFTVLSVVDGEGVGPVLPLAPVPPPDPTDGDVVGPGAATANAIARFSGITGKLIKNSSVVVGDLGELTGVTSINGAPVATGDVVGPGAAVDNALARFDLLTGKLIQSSIAVLGDLGDLSGITALNGALIGPRAYTPVVISNLANAATAIIPGPAAGLLRCVHSIFASVNGAPSGAIASLRLADTVTVLAIGAQTNTGNTGGVALVQNPLIIGAGEQIEILNNGGNTITALTYLYFDFPNTNRTLVRSVVSNGPAVTLIPAAAAGFRNRVLSFYAPNGFLSPQNTVNMSRIETIAAFAYNNDTATMILQFFVGATFVAKRSALTKVVYTLGTGFLFSVDYTTQALTVVAEAAPTALPSVIVFCYETLPV